MYLDAQLEYQSYRVIPHSFSSEKAKREKVENIWNKSSDPQIEYSVTNK